MRFFAKLFITEGTQNSTICFVQPSMVKFVTKGGDRFLSLQKVMALVLVVRGGRRPLKSLIHAIC